jgi:LysM repeat protein
MVLASPWTFEGEAISIPGPELKAVEVDLPAWAEFRIMNVDGVVLDRERVRLPPSYAAGAAPGEPVEAPTIASARRFDPPETPTPSDEAEGISEPPAPPPRRPSRRRDTFDRRTSPTARRERAEAVQRLAEAQRGVRPTEEAAPPPPPDAAAPVIEAAPARDVRDERPAEPAVQPAPASEQPAPSSSPPAPQPETPAPAAPAPAREYREYVVQAGDTLIGISKRELRDATRWYEIFDGNRDVLRSPDELRAGMTLRLPPASERRRPESGG